MPDVLTPDEIELRLQCLKLAAVTGPEAAVERAREYLAFVKDQPSSDSL